MSTGLFFVRRDRICSTRRISPSRPITGSGSPRAASSVRSRLYWSSTFVSLRRVVLAAAGGEAGWANCRCSGAKRLTTSVYSLFMSPPAPVMSRAAVQSGSRRIPRSTCSVPTR